MSTTRALSTDAAVVSYAADLFKARARSFSLDVCSVSDTCTSSFLGFWGFASPPWICGEQLSLTLNRIWILCEFRLPDRSDLTPRSDTTLRIPQTMNTSAKISRAPIE